MRKILLTSLFLIFSSTSITRSQEILVEASSLAQPQQTIQSVSPQSVSLKETLNLLPGITLASLTGLISPRDIFFLRGFSPERVYVYQDEFPVNSSGIRGNFYFDLSAFNTTNIKKVRVIYGPSVVYGANPGGNLIVETESFPSYREFSIETLTGSYGTVKAGFTYKDFVNSTGFDISFGGLRSNGYLRNDFVEASSGKFSLYHLIGESTVLKFSLEKNRVKDGLPVLNDPDNPIAGYDPDYPVVRETYFSLACAPYCKLNLVYRPGDNYIDRTTNRFAFSFLRDTGSGLFNLALYSNTSLKRERYYGIFKTPAGKKLTSMSFDGRDDKTYGLRALFEEFKFFKSTGTLGLEFQNSGYGEIEKNNHLFVPANKTALRRYALFGELKREIPFFMLNVGLRVESWEGNALGAPNISGTEFMPTVTLTKDFGNLQLFAGVGRVYRPPRAEEILWFGREYSALKSSGYTGYKLKAERGWDYEIGLRKKVEEFGFSIRFFRYEIRNFIVSNFEAAERLLGENFPHRIVENLRYFRLNGAELGTLLRLPYDFSFYSSYAYQDSKISSSQFTPDKTPDPTVLVPKHKLSLLLIKKNLLKKDSLSLTGNFYSRRKGYYEEVPGFGVFNVSYRLVPLENISFKFALNNLFNKKYFYVENYEMPGRNFQISMRVNF